MPITNGGGEIWGQHPCGIGVPAVAMGFPGYVAQPQLALGNSEMIWSDIFDWFLKVSSVISAISLFQIIKTPVPSGGGENAVGTTFAGYVAQPQLGLGNSEMTWSDIFDWFLKAVRPYSALGWQSTVLAGAARALGTTYYPPYIAVDGAYHPCSLGRTSLTGSSRLVLLYLLFL
ncbi:hypothetical protein Pint_03755 [Pistacia integerrima]|uniref:Uncharacterized protein n=1 Tax=Pistacia integerrima TaxID=434235 RepID=A0ACC0Z4T9_9ROSI|nr:hypothetical protein Pint_03755 [Pistacia integerrima]